MGHVIVTPEWKSLLSDLSDPIVILDESGKRLGVFSPAASHSLYESVDSPASDDELHERLRDPAPPPEDGWVDEPDAEWDSQPISSEQSGELTFVDIDEFLATF